MGEAATNRTEALTGEATDLPEAHRRGRPGYPAAMVEWLLADLAGPDALADLDLAAGDRPVVLEVGAGTGALTAALVETGAEVLATDPDEAMLTVLRRELPDVPTTTAAAESLPLEDRSVDVVVAASCLDLMDVDRALPELARVLRPGGRLVVLRHERDERIPWVRRLGRMLGDGAATAGADPREVVEASGLFDPAAEQRADHWHGVDSLTVLDLARSAPAYTAAADEEARTRLLAEVRALYADYGRGMDGMQLPYRTVGVRARVADHVSRPPAPEPVEPQAAAGGASSEVLSGPFLAPHTTARPDATRGSAPDPLVDSAATLPRVVLDGVDDAHAMVLIDLR